nr:retrovirus-related Pol polyprotein from transposon TNT 1-94 [Tanacetum cinerariifolium]
MSYLSDFQELNGGYVAFGGIKREFNVPRTPQKNDIDEKKNRTFIEAARTMLVDSLLPILFWAEAVTTACYVQNKVLVTKPQKKTPFELLHGRTPSIGFMRPFGCPVTILNTLDPLGKFEGKVDEGFLVGYSLNRKAFRVFNSRTRIVQETLHVKFLKNKPNVAGTGPPWLFDNDSLTRTMNYQPVTAGNQSNSNAGFQEEFDVGKIVEEANQQYMLFLVWSTGSTNPQNKEGDATFAGKEHDAEKPDFDDFSEDNSNDVSAASPIVLAAGHNYSNNTNLISADGPLNSNSSSTHGKSSLKDTYLPPNMVEREDIVYSDHENVGAEADFNNLKLLS